MSSFSNINFFLIFDIFFSNITTYKVFQSLSMMPGISRAGIVILAMLLLKYEREDLAIYSFLISVLTILSAGIFDLYKTSIQDFSTIS